jgi:hypothetical protein
LAAVVGLKLLKPAAKIGAHHSLQSSAVKPTSTSAIEARAREVSVVGTAIVAPPL